MAVSATALSGRHIANVIGSVDRETDVLGDFGHSKDAVNHWDRLKVDEAHQPSRIDRPGYGRLLQQMSIESQGPLLRRFQPEGSMIVVNGPLGSWDRQTALGGRRVKGARLAQQQAGARARRSIR
jgi:hypothetical protein